MKANLILLVGLLLQGFLWGAEPLPGNKSLSMCSGGEVVISGHSNIGGFALTLELKDSFVRPAYSPEDSGGSFYHQIVLPVDRFEGRSPKMKRDFMELVRASIFPDIFITLENMEPSSGPVEEVDVITWIRMAGIERNYRVPCRVEYQGERLVRIEGSREIAISDFNLELKNRFLGLVKIREQISIHFWITFV